MFAWSEKELNKEQSNAVLYENNVLLVACPGSGKTRTLTYKIAYELSNLPNKNIYIIAITYTNRAADEIKERIELLGIDTTQLWIGTIHAFCLEWILRPYSSYLPEFKNGFRLINNFETEKIITNICDKYNKKNQLYGQDRITYWDCTFTATPKPGFKITSHNKAKHDSIKNILRSYLNHLKTTNRIDFEQILYYSLKLLKDKKQIAVILSKIFPYILIDEYQDTKEIQYHIICSILNQGKGGTQLFIVGDPNQAIYQTLGGYPIELEELETLSNLKIKQLELNKNYRSSKKIINYFEHFRTLDNRNEASGNNHDYNSIISLNKTVLKEDLIDEIATIIEHNIDQLGISQNEICVLGPQWVHLSSVAKKLIVRLPDYSFDGPGMAPFSRDIDNFWYHLAKLALTEPAPNMYIKRLRWSKDILRSLYEEGFDLSNTNNKKLLKFCNSITLNENDGLTYLELFFDMILEHLELNLSDSKMLTEHYHSFFESSKNRIERLKKEDIESVGSTDNFKKVFKQRNGITVATFHGVKGAEYDSVIAFALLNDYIPHFSDPDGLRNAKKLLYVISSRARKNLFLISERGRLKKFGNPPEEYRITDHLKTYNYDYDPF